MREPSLDSASIYDELDSEGLLGRIAALPAQIAEAWSAGRAFELPTSYREADRIVVLGMGGSGIGGSLLAALATDIGARVPVSVVRGYKLPGYVNERSLVLASSNSGNTEEVVSAFRAALGVQAKCVAVATGGTLLALARAHDVPALTFAWDAEPRAALGWSFGSLLAICGRAGLLPDLSADMAQALDEMRALNGEICRDVAEASNPAKQLARRLAGRLPVFIGAEALAPVAYRWRTQVNENAKSWAIADELPEMNHNAHLGYGLPSAAVPFLHVVLLRHAAIHPRIALRVDATADAMHSFGLSVEVLEIEGASVLSQMLRAVLLGDYVSFYLGLLNGVHPSPMDALESLKALLASKT